MEFVALVGAVYLGTVFKDVTLAFYVALVQKRAMKKRNLAAEAWEARLLAEEAANLNKGNGNET